MHDLAILGAGGVGRQVSQIIRDINAVDARWHLVGYLDDDTTKIGEVIGGIPVLGDLQWLSQRDNVYVTVAMGSPSMLYSSYERLKSMRHQRIATLVHPSVWMPERVDLDPGAIIYAGVMLDTDIKIGKGCIINKGCTIGHDTILGDYCSLAPGVNLGGSVQVGPGCYFGISSATIQNLEIGDWSILGAGAVAISDIPPNVTAVGVPARIVKTRKEGWHKS